MYPALRRMFTNPVGIVSGAVVLLLALAAVAGPTLYPVDPFALSVEVNAAPSWLHPLGTDDLGRDVLAGMIEGAKISLFVGISAALATTVIGVLVGAVAGYVGGRVDAALMRLSEFFQVMPTFILAVLIVSLIGPGLTRVIIVIAVLSWPQTARVARGEIMRVSQLDYVDAARCMGIPGWRILYGEVIPNAIAPALALASLIMAQAILLEASLSFLGLASPDIISWGRILSVAQQYLFTAWWLSVFSGMAIFITVLAFNLLGDALADALNPRHAH
ncbi:ABC transporter permease [Ancylobacter sp. MQZ15Z-1]|uniref:ABC transporter permease n=1 Tax=Ancylobacter mangrovi TaxID=2972472 RepID=A0A9X2T1W5_9HYPH|nr:ABC transporter permease [Ancylobacter mangrovi]MCS0495530.1 ABC transporter permease [Ancylobacter mangrovi]